MYRSSLDSARTRVIWDTYSPEWDEEWHVRNVSPQAKLRVRMFDKDERPWDEDDFICEFTMDLTQDFNGPVMVRSVKGSDVTIWLEVRDPQC